MDFAGQTTFHEAKRRVRATYEFPPGAVTLTWGGRSAGGHEKGSGVYFLRFEARPLAGGPAFQRVVRLVRMK